MTRRVVIVGTEEGRCVLDVCRATGREVAGFIDMVGLAGDRVNDCPVLGGEDRLADGTFLRAFDFIVTAGDSARRLDCAARIEAAGGAFATVVHPSCTVSPYSRIGTGTVLMGHDVINPQCRIGDHVIIDWNAVIGHDTVLEDGVFVAPGCHIGGRIVCKRGAFVGLGANVVPDIVIGAWAVVGAGATVIRDIPDGAVAVGSPAKVVKQRDMAQLKG